MAPPELQLSPDFLAPRSQLAQAPALTYWSAFLKASSDLWTPYNPGGYVCAAVAENRLTTDLVAEGLKRHGSSWDPDMLYYQDARGTLALRTQTAALLQDTFMAGVVVDPAHLTVLAGVGSLLDALFHCIAGPGDAVLVPAPFYPAFDNDLRVRNDVHPIPAHLDLTQPDLGPGLDAAAADAAAAGRRLAGVLFTHPTNPQGLLLSEAQVASVVAWCLARRVHCISDEIYALSVFDETAAAFTSTAQVVARRFGAATAADPATAALAAALVHVVWGASKDFCGSGLRIGVLLSANQGLNMALGNVGYFASVPGPLQQCWAQLLDDRAWLQHFLQENRRRLRAAYASLAGALDAAGVPHTRASGGMFAWLDLRGAFGPDASGPPSWEDEAALWQRLVEQHRVVLTPGAACHASEPGFFRLCWAWPHPGCLPVAAQRIAAAVAAHARSRGGSSSSSNTSNGAQQPKQQPKRHLDQQLQGAAV